MEGNKQKNHLGQKLIKIVNRALEEGSDRKECVTKPEIWPEFNPQDSHAENWPANCLLTHALHAPSLISNTNKCNLKYLRAAKIASQIKVLSTKFDHLSSIPQLTRWKELTHTSYPASFNDLNMLTEAHIWRDR